jgi:eukaryotic-like serine/threonine-protein kinase
MYLTVDTGDGFHIWRQEFPDGTPQQVTSGANNEEGLSFASDCHSLVTSVGSAQSTLWLHDAKGDRQLSLEGSASVASFSRDGSSLYYLVRKRFDLAVSQGELWTMDLATGESQAVLPGIAMTTYSFSPDGTKVTYDAIGADGKSHIWIGSLERRFAPRELPTPDEFRPFYSPDGSIYARETEGKQNYLYRMKEDGSERQKVYSTPIITGGRVTPDGRWIVVIVPSGNEDHPIEVGTIPTAGGSFRPICDICGFTWSPDGKYFIVGGFEATMESTEKTFVVPLKNSGDFPPVPPAGWKSEQDINKLPGVSVIEHREIEDLLDCGTYAYTQQSVHRNLYRIPIP